MFVPSLTWQNDYFVHKKWTKSAVLSPDTDCGGVHEHHAAICRLTVNSE
jgi:hypothetical protein